MLVDMKHQIIFLDIDGVLNPIDSVLNNVDWPAIETRPLMFLNDLMSDLDSPQIVVISSWRNLVPFSDLRIYLDKKGLPREWVRDFTPEHDSRALEIREWLSLNRDSWESFVILDDFPVFGYSSYQVRPNCLIGLTHEDKEKALEIIRRQICESHYPMAK